jgi:nitroreductase
MMDLASVDHVLMTTRAVRKRLDLTRPVEPEIIQQCIDIALQAPNGGNRGKYHFMVVTEPAKRAAIAKLYNKAIDDSNGRADPGALPLRVWQSAIYLADHLHEVPVHIIACVEGRVEDEGPFLQSQRYGSILPAAWSLMLALRARGVGSSWTNLHVLHEAEVSALLGIPENMTHGVLIPAAYFTGDDFKPAKRLPGRERTYWNTWGDTR